MKIKRFFEALPVVAALLLTASCTNEDNDMLVPQPETPAVKTIPFTVTVSTSTDTRATLADTYSGYVFEEGDELYVQDASGDVYGMLTLASGEGTGNATFSGGLNYTDEPEATLELTAVLKSSRDEIVEVSNDKVTDILYPADVYAESLQEAIQKYSYFTGTATYGNPAFTLDQKSAFLHFTISLNVGEIDTTVPTQFFVFNNDEVFCSNEDVTISEGKIEFYTAVADETELADAFISLVIPFSNLVGDSQIPLIYFGGDTKLAANHVYNVTKRLVNLAIIKSDFEAQNGDILFGPFGMDYFDELNEESFTDHMVLIPDGAKVTLCYADINLNDLPKIELPGITCEGDATIIIEEGNQVVGNGAHPGIFVPEGKTLTIKGTGYLYVRGGTIEDESSISQGAAGIGSGVGESCGNIDILDGDIEANGGYGAPGIGSGTNGSCGNITFSGGNIWAYAGDEAPTAIGNANGDGTCASVTIGKNISQITMKNEYASDEKVKNFIDATKIQAQGSSTTMDITTFKNLDVDNAYISTGMSAVGLTSYYDSENKTWTVSK